MPKGVYKRKPFTNEHKKRLSESRIGKSSGMLGKKAWNKGKKTGSLSDEIRKKLSESKRGKKHWAFGKKFSEKSKKKMSKSHIGLNTGDKHPNWKGGISKGYKRGYNSIKYKKWRKKVFERDNYTCQKCGFKGNHGYITAHHIKSWAKFIKLRYIVNNGMTLCEKCHSETDNYKGRNNKKKL